MSAYAGQGPRLKQKAVVQAALAIHSVEARHAAHFRTLAGMCSPRTRSTSRAR